MALPKLPPPDMVHVDAQGYSTHCYTSETMQQYALAALRAQPAGWMPIETAPKDGTVILGYRDGRIGMASKVPRNDCEMWTFCGTSADVASHPSVKPTHWMPLPPPPGQKQAQPDHSELIARLRQGAINGGYPTIVPMLREAADALEGI